MNNNTSNSGSQKRFLLAMVLSFAFFIAYDHFYLKPLKVQQDQVNKTIQNMSSKTNENEIVKNTPINNKVTPSSINSSSVNKNVPTSQFIDKENIIATINTNGNIISIDSLGRVAQVTLLDEAFKTETGGHIKLFNQNQLRPLEVRFSNQSINKEAFNIKVTANKNKLDARKFPQELILTQNMSDTTLTKTIKFYPDGHYDIRIDVTNNEEFFITPGYRPDVLADMYADHGAMIKGTDDVITIIEDEDLEKVINAQNIKFASAFDRYYATLFYNFKNTLEVSLLPSKDESPEIFIHAKNTISLSGYMGPKTYKTLDNINTELTDVIEYGWFTFIAKPMFLLLQYVHGHVGNWGWTIVFVTILIKLLMYPLAYKGMYSMNKLKELNPKIKAIQEKYKSEPQKSGAKMMEFYKKENVNPMGGCLPIIMQIPIFFSIYRVLLNAIELKGAPWMLWVHDLAEMDPYYILPILMGATMFIQQLITPNQIQDEMQKKLFKFLPLIFTVFFLWFPAGLTLYWFINNLFTIGQQYYINKLFEKAKITRKNEHLSHKQVKKD